MKQHSNGILDSYTLGNSHFDEIYAETKQPRTIMLQWLNGLIN